MPVVSFALMLGCADAHLSDGDAGVDQPCVLGTYDHDADPLTACVTWTTCVAGEYVASSGSASRDRLCRPCAPGTYCAGDAAPVVTCHDAEMTWDHDAHPATPCSPLRECAPGSFVSNPGSSVADRVCAACAAGTYSDTANADACAAWTPCAMGFVPWPVGTSISDQGCTQQAWDWAVQYGPGTATDGQCMAVLGSGVLVNVGFTYDAFPGYTNAGSADLYVRAFNADGSERWTHQLGTPGWDNAASAVSDTTGAIYVVGSADGALPGMTSLGGTDAFIRKYDADGVVLWTRQFGTTGGDYAEKLAVDSAGNVYVVGSTSGSFPGFSIVGQSAAFVRKYDAAGNVIWTRQFGEDGDVFGDAVATVEDTHVYVVGAMYQPFSGLPVTGSLDVFVRKYDSSGAEIWTRTLGSTEYDHAHGAAVDELGGLILVGHTDGVLPGQPDEPGSKGFIWKWSAAGEPLWGRLVSGDEWGSADAVGAAGLGNFYVVGSVSRAFAGQVQSGMWDAFVRLYDSSGDVLWTRQFGSSQGDAVCGVGLDDAGFVYVSGGTAGAIPRAVGTGTRFVMRLTPVDL